MSRHACPAHGCQAQISTSLLMCPDHWLMVPRWLRSEVNRTWRAFNRALIDGSADAVVSEAISIYQETSAAAVAAVNLQLAPVQ